MKDSKFRRWVYETGGPYVLAEKIGVTYQAVYKWLHRHHGPGILTAEKIVKLSKGKLTYQDIAEGVK